MSRQNKINPLSILILEDNDAVAGRLQRILHDWDRVEKVTRKAFLSETLKVIDREKFDVFIADIHVPDGSGITAIREMKTKQGNCQSIVISALSERPLVLEALKSGAMGYILKDDDSVGIIAAIEAILGGCSPISSGIARHVIDLLQSSSHFEYPPGVDTPVLTSREVEILNIIAKGFTNKEVAEILCISPQTVPVHVRNIYKKLQASNRSEATYEARRLGIIKS